MRNLVSIVIVPLLLALVPVAAQAADCEGFIIYKKEGDKLKRGDLKCNGECEDGKQCSVQTNDDKTHEWCGCKGEPEPTLCHLSLVQAEDPRSKKKFWGPSCSGPCPPEGSPDVCTPQSRPGKGKGETVLQCECLEPQGN